MCARVVYIYRYINAYTCDPLHPQQPKKKKALEDDLPISPSVGAPTFDSQSLFPIKVGELISYPICSLTILTSILFFLFFLTSTMLWILVEIPVLRAQQFLLHLCQASNSPREPSWRGPPETCGGAPRTACGRGRAARGRADPPGLIRRNPHGHHGRGLRSSFRWAYQPYQISTDESGNKPWQGISWSSGLRTKGWA